MTLSASTRPFIVAHDDGPEIALLRGAVVALGNFDGVHRGHRAVIAAAISRAQTLGCKAAALTLEPHPRSVFKPDEPLFRLTDERNKLRLFAATGLDGAVVLTFNRELAATPAEAFVSDILVRRLGVRGVALGFDFHFGQKRGGSPEFLAQEGARHGFAVDIVSPFEDGGERISSGAIRAALVEGKVTDAARLLGFPWFVSGAVVHGEKRGRDLGFPTANVALDPACGLRHGIYAVRVGAGSARHDGVASFGRRPMFDNGPPLLEVFLFDFAGDLYGKAIDVAFIAWLRPELKFDSVETLTRQMNEDARRAREELMRAGDAFPPLGALI
jgi:riboflavin kinase/FMN adenylyltransferase